MEAVPAPHENWKSLLLAGRIDPSLVRQFGTLLGHLHRTSAEARETLPAGFGDRGYFEALRLAPYYETAAARHPAAARFLSSLIADTRSIRDCLVHGDYSPKNILVRQRRLILLDHEVVHLGDPAFDVGFSLTHLLSKARHTPKRQDALFEAAHLHWAAYRAEFQTGLSTALEARAVRHTLACLLARVDGRSPLEYLRPAEREQQRQFALSGMNSPPESIPALIDAAAASQTNG